MYHTLKIEDGLGNLDKILPSRSNSFNIGRRGSRASCFSRRGSNWSSGSLVSVRSPLMLDVSDKKWFLASSDCQMKQLKELHGVDASFLNKKDFFTGYSALHWASKQGKSELVHWLCELGADVNLRSNGGYTPLHLAVMNGRTTIVDILISDYEADINTRDYSGRKPLHYAQSDTPNWVQNALRGYKPVLGDKTKLDPLAASSTDFRSPNLAVMHGRPISRSWGSFNNEAVGDDVIKRGVDHRDSRDEGGGVKVRTKSILRSFRKIRNKDKTNRTKEHGHRNDDRAKSSPEVCYTPRTRQKQVQIEHPHFAALEKGRITPTTSENNQGLDTHKRCMPSEREISPKEHGDMKNGINPTHVSSLKHDANTRAKGDMKNGVSSAHVSSPKHHASTTAKGDMQSCVSPANVSSPKHDASTRSEIKTTANGDTKNFSSPKQVRSPKHDANGKQDRVHDSYSKHDEIISPRSATNGKVSSRDYKGPRTDNNANQWKISTMV